MDDARRSTTRADGGGSSIVRVTAEAAAPDLFFDAHVDAPADRYEIKSEIAAGGMGRVLEAWDTQNGRAVAIKVLLRRGQRAERRFAREARVHARLVHPAIAPMYEAGRLPTGEPFLSLTLVRGRSLGEVAREARTLPERLGLLSHVVAMCEGVAYAHESKVVHRDLKPSNVLIGRFGETVIIDWGLAKNLGEPPGEDGEDGPPAPEEVADGALTLDGAAVGTPAYMPPEQARGEPVDERADVYALGAILYFVLSGSPPFDRDVAPTHVAASRPAPLARVAPEAPPDLVTIADKAMSRDPADRYPSARELADDLKRFATGQLVSAHRYSPLALARRWAARNRAPLAVAVALILVLVATAALSLRRIVREERQADAARGSAETHRRAAESLVDFIVGTLRERLEPLGRLDLMSGVGDEVLGYYRRVDAASYTALDAAALNRRAAAFETLADVETAKRDPEAAIRLWDRAIEWRRRAQEATADPRDDAASSQLVHDEVRAADLRVAGAKLPEAEARVARASEACAAALAKARTVPLLLAEADVLGEAASIARTEEHSAEADADLEASIARVEEAAGRAPEDDAVLWAVHRAHFDRGMNLLLAQDCERARADFTVSADALGRQLSRRPDDTKLLRALGWTNMELADAERGLRHMDLAIGAARALLDVRTRIAQIDPANAQARSELMATELLLCELESDVGRLDEGLAPCRDARARADQMLAETPEDYSAAVQRVQALVQLGRATLASGRPGEAQGLLEQAVTSASALTERQGVRYGWMGLANAAQILGRVDLVRRDLPAAAAACGTAASAVSQLRGDELYEPYAAESGLLCGQAALARGDFAQAEARLREALPLAEAAREASPADVDSQVRAAIVLFALGAALERGRGAPNEMAVLRQRGHALVDPLKASGALWPEELEALEALGVRWARGVPRR